jgi:hypothetical protein
MDNLEVSDWNSYERVRLYFSLCWFAFAPFPGGLGRGFNK